MKKINTRKIDKYYMDISSVKSKYGLQQWFLNILDSSQVGDFDYEIDGVNFLSVDSGIVDLFYKPEKEFAKMQKLKQIDIEYLPEFKLAIKHYFEKHY